MYLHAPRRKINMLASIADDPINLFSKQYIGRLDKMLSCMLSLSLMQIQSTVSHDAALANQLP